MSIYEINRLRDELNKAFPEGRIRAEHTATSHWYRNIDTGELAPSVTTIQGILDKPYLRQWSVNQAIGHIIQHSGRFIRESEIVIQEAKSAHENVRDQAAEWGTKAHQAFEDYLNDWIKTGTHKESAKDYLKEGAAIEEIAACRSFDRFMGENEIVPIAAELKVWYDKAGVTFAGTADAIVVVRDVYKDRVGGQGCNHDYAPQEKKLWCCMCGREVIEKLILLDHKTSNQINKPEYAQQTEAYTRAIETATGLKFKDIWVARYDKTRAEYEVLRVIDRKSAWNLFKANAKHFAAKQKYKTELLAPLKVKETLVI